MSNLTKKPLKGGIPAVENIIIENINPKTGEWLAISFKLVI
jgi:hypothetical protein